MAYGVSAQGGNRTAVALPRARADRALTRNALIAGIAFASLTVVAAGVLMRGNRDFAGAQAYNPAHNSLHTALVDPAATPPGAVMTSSVAKVAPQAVVAQAERIPLPPSRPRQMAAVIPLPRERVAEKAAEALTVASVERPHPNPPPLSKSDLSDFDGLNSPKSGRPDFGRGAGEERSQAAEKKESTRDGQENTVKTRVATVVASELPPIGAAEPVAPHPNPPPQAGEGEEKPVRLAMAYAPTREQIFETEVTGSLGRAASAKALDAAAVKTTTTEKARAAVKPPQPVVKIAKAHRLTPFEKLWGPVRVASLNPLDGIAPSGAGNVSGNVSGLPRAPYDRQTAVYVITDKKVYLPDGTAVEAHSGLGDKMDDPRYVHVRMRGATPPHVYELKMREALFHGVEAIRMLPVGGEGAIFGRDGILAHTYMLGPNGQSNGCVSFRDYDAFLDAFKDGKFTRLAVIARLD